ncbi:hypothetical protein F5879DRAFT_993015 [Lentinula edodes]|nr:hypothetical protein F5879DRAFT_993015 [Lentinula edodes]
MSTSNLPYPWSSHPSSATPSFRHNILSSNNEPVAPRLLLPHPNADNPSALHVLPSLSSPLQLPPVPPSPSPMRRTAPKDSLTTSHPPSPPPPFPQSPLGPGSTGTQPAVQLVVPRAVVDGLARDFSLTDVQRKIMQTFLHFGSVGQGLSKPDLLTRLYQLAITFDLENKRPKADGIDVQTMQAMMKDLKIRLEQTFSLTRSQTRTIRLLAQEKMFDPMRTCYMGVNQDVFDYIRAHSEELNYSNVMGNPSYELVMLKEVKKACSSIRNNFRQHLRDSITVYIDAVAFTHKMKKLYQRPGGVTYDDRLLLLRNIILRRYMVDHPNTVWVEEELTDDTTSDVDNAAAPSNADGSTRPAKRPRTVKSSAGGRVPKGQDFWSLIDSWFYSKKDLGKRLTDEGWKQLLEGYVRFDEAGFKSRASSPQPTADGQLDTHAMQTRRGWFDGDGPGSSALALVI